MFSKECTLRKFIQKEPMKELEVPKTLARMRSDWQLSIHKSNLKPPEKEKEKYNEKIKELVRTGKIAMLRGKKASTKNHTNKEEEES